MSTYQVEFTDGRLQNDLTAEEAQELFDNDEYVVAIRPYPVPPYKAP